MRDDRLANGLPGELVIPTTLAFVVSAWASASRTGEGLPLALMTTTREVALKRYTGMPRNANDCTARH
ncbi:Uncharacterised protein [Klebsiella pneumoniae]|nr:Uncharacterised protein [Klebsiella pneumoniae]